MFLIKLSQAGFTLEMHMHTHADIHMHTKDKCEHN